MPASFFFFQMPSSRIALFASVSNAGAASAVIEWEKEAFPSADQLLRRPLALLALVPDGAVLFSAGTISGAAAKSVTAPFDRVKLLMQTHGLRVTQGTEKKAFGFIDVIRISPYSAGQLFSYEIYKKFFRNKNGKLSVLGRLVASACAGMTSTLMTLSMLREEGFASFYAGLGPSLVSMAPYIAVQEVTSRKVPKEAGESETSLTTALISATFATLMCYPLDTVRRQMKGSPYNTILDAFPGIVERDGVVGLYRGFVPNALKSLPNSSIKLTAFDTVKSLIASGRKELEKIVDGNKENLAN